VQRLWVDGKKDDAIREVPEEMILKTSLIGTEEMIREKLRAFRDIGVNALRLSTGGNDWRERTDKLAEAVDLIKRETGTWTDRS
jgi:alkanesulfonate monooxygenase SsuD/methylene tetrahydromethanopterin reductase-like flavin-dependent oxidoreductase (luciferase family)